MADEGLQVTLAVSLHTPDDELRDTLVPVNTRWKVAEVIPLNPTPGSKWDASPKPVEREFVRRVNAARVSCTVRMDWNASVQSEVDIQRAAD